MSAARALRPASPWVPPPRARRRGQDVGGRADVPLDVAGFDARGDLAGGPHGGTSRRPLNARAPALPQLSVRGADAHLTGTES